jgi:hypothetical protein
VPEANHDKIVKIRKDESDSKKSIKKYSMNEEMLYGSYGINETSFLFVLIDDVGDVI